MNADVLILPCCSRIKKKLLLLLLLALQKLSTVTACLPACLADNRIVLLLREVRPRSFHRAAAG